MHASKLCGKRVDDSNRGPEIRRFRGHNKLSRHNPNHCVGVSAQLHRLAEAVLSSAKVALPESVTQHDNAVAAETIVFIGYRAADRGSYAESFEQVGVYQRCLPRNRLPVPRDSLGRP